MLTTTVTFFSKTTGSGRDAFLPSLRFLSYLSSLPAQVPFLPCVSYCLPQTPFLCTRHLSLHLDTSLFYFFLLYFSSVWEFDYPSDPDCPRITDCPRRVKNFLDSFRFNQGRKGNQTPGGQATVLIHTSVLTTDGSFRLFLDVSSLTFMVAGRWVSSIQSLQSSLGCLTGFITRESRVLNVRTGNLRSTTSTSGHHLDCGIPLRIRFCFEFCTGRENSKMGSAQNSPNLWPRSVRRLEKDNRRI
jgi:hypothetical protein